MDVFLTKYFVIILKKNRKLRSHYNMCNIGGKKEID